MKSNPVLYPIKKFPKIKNFQKNKVFDSKTISFKEISDEYSKIKNKEIKVSGKTVVDKIFSVFLSKEFLFGRKEHVINSKKEIYSVINSFIKDNKPIKMSLLCFPFKVEIPLKTNRSLADMGELLLIHQLTAINKTIKRIYSPGTSTTIFTEEIFAEFAGVKQSVANKYIQSIKNYLKLLKEDTGITFISLSTINKNKNFSTTFSQNKKKATLEIQKKQGIFYKKYLKSYPAVYRIISVKNVPVESLYRIYNSKSTDLSNKETKVASIINKKTHDAIINYLAFLETKNILKFTENILGEHLALTLSPKRDKIGIIPINTNTSILPHHGVPVKKIDGKWTILYLMDIKTNSKKYKVIHLKNDKDSAPFYYQEI